MLILLLNGLRIRGEFRLGLTDPANRLGCFRLPFRAMPLAAVSVW
jgi:hypothetical protein